jgi:L,D-peptidoglycan transpeptidase YkuD (ErfK/YbiS/YcfS/YnhG family)
LALVTTGLWLGISGWEDQRPAAKPQSVRDSARRAITFSRRDFPDDSRALESLLSDAEKINAIETAAFAWQRDDDRVSAAWYRVASRAWESTRRARTRQRESERRWLELAPVAHAELAEARTSLREGAGLGRREMSALERAEFQLATAEGLARAGDLARAIRAGEKSLEFAAVVSTGWDNLHRRFSDPKLLRTWRAWVAATIAESKRNAAPAIIVDKLRRELHVYDDGIRMATYPAELGANGLLPKNHAGDRATPEGRYSVVETRQNGATKYYKALLLNYPNAEDRERFRAAQQRGTIPVRVGIGNLIEVHGEGGKSKDWTNGCVALSNRDMDKVFKRSRAGTPVTIVGTF